MGSPTRRMFLFAGLLCANAQQVLITTGRNHMSSQECGEVRLTTTHFVIAALRIFCKQTRADKENPMSRKIRLNSLFVLFAVITSTLASAFPASAAPLAATTSVNVSDVFAGT